MQQNHKPELSDAALSPAYPIEVQNEFGEIIPGTIPGEVPLTLKVDDMEIVTLMTLGTRPEALALGYLRNQRLIEDLGDIRSVKVDWDRETVDITTNGSADIHDWQQKLERRIVTSGCGQGTIFSCTVDKLYGLALESPPLRQSDIYQLIRHVSRLNAVYRVAGAVHGCALCTHTESLLHVEDVGRHNAADAISGLMWLQNIDGADKIFYTTGRLTSEIVMKTAFMGIPVLLSRSGITQMGLELATELGVTIIARAKGRHFLVYSGFDTVLFDQKPARRLKKPPSKGQLDVILSDRD